MTCFGTGGRSYYNGSCSLMSESIAFGCAASITGLGSGTGSFRPIVTLSVDEIVLLSLMAYRALVIGPASFGTGRSMSFTCYPIVSVSQNGLGRDHSIANSTVYCRASVFGTGRLNNNGLAGSMRNGILGYNVSLIYGSAELTGIRSISVLSTGCGNGSAFHVFMQTGCRYNVSVLGYMAYGALVNGVTGILTSRINGFALYPLMSIGRNSLGAYNSAAHIADLLLCTVLGAGSGNDIFVSGRMLANSINDGTGVIVHINGLYAVDRRIAALVNNSLVSLAVSKLQFKLVAYLSALGHLESNGVEDTAFLSAVSAFALIVGNADGYDSILTGNICGLTEIFKSFAGRISLSALNIECHFAVIGEHITVLDA